MSTNRTKSTGLPNTESSGTKPSNDEDFEHPKNPGRIERRLPVKATQMTFI